MLCEKNVFQIKRLLKKPPETNSAITVTTVEIVWERASTATGWKCPVHLRNNLGPNLGPNLG
jgi:hypothetical protein